jgi:hypothetical protein
LLLESLFCTLTGLVVVRLPITHADAGVSTATERYYERSRRAGRPTERFGGTAA